MELSNILEWLGENWESIFALVAAAVAIWQKTQGSKKQKIAKVLILAIEEFTKDTGDKKIKKLIKEKQVPELDHEVKKTVSG